MANAQTQIANMYRNQLETSRRFADLMFSGTEKIDHVVIEATHRAFTDQLDFVEEFASTREPNAAVNLQSNFFSQAPKNAVICQKEIMRICSEIQNEMSRSMKDYMGQFGSTMVDTKRAERVGSPSLASEGAFVNPITGMFSVLESAFKEVASLANNNLDVARSNVGQIGQLARDAVSKSSEEAKSAFDRIESSSEKVADAATEIAATPNASNYSNNNPAGANGGQNPTYSALEGGELADETRLPSGAGFGAGTGGGKRK